jgi:uncharacterized protein DUF4129
VSGARKLLLSGAAVTALLAVVAIASRAHSPGGGTGGGSVHAPTLLIQYLGVIAVVIMPLGAVIVVWGLAHGRRMKVLEGKTSWRRTMLGLALGLVLLAIAVFATGSHRLDPNARTTEPTGIAGPLHAAGGAQERLQRRTPPQQTSWRWLPAYVLGSIMLGLLVTAAVAIALRRSQGEELDREAELARALDAVLADTLDDLRAERDPRKAVIRAYARMEQLFAAYGAPRAAAQTPLEYVATALDRLHVSSFAVTRLTQLFERAKFSPHEIGVPMKDEAIEVLVGLRQELEADKRVAA